MSYNSFCKKYLGSITKKHASQIKISEIIMKESSLRNIKSEVIRSSVANGSWNDVANQLVSWSSSERSSSRCENALLDILGLGQTEQLRQALIKIDDLPILLKLFVADAASRVQALSPGELQTLFREVGAQSRVDLRLWLSAITAEFHLWQGELTGLWTAQNAIFQAPDVDSRVALMARGRLRRMQAIALVMTTGPLDNTSEQLLKQVDRDLKEARLPEERCGTRGLVACIRVFAFAHESVQQLNTIKDVLNELEEYGSDRKEIMLLGLGWAAGAEWDFETLKYCIEQLGLNPKLKTLPVLRDALELLRLYFELQASGPQRSIMQEMIDVFQDLKTRTIRFPSAVIFLSSYLLDLGAVDEAERLCQTVIGFTDLAVTFASEYAVKELELRIMIHRKRTKTSVDEILPVIQTWEESGWSRQAAKLSLRVARDCYRSGLYSEAKVMHARGVSDLPPVRERTKWEQWLELPPEKTMELPLDSIKVLGPQLLVERKGRKITLTKAGATLVGLLAFERKKLTSEWIMEKMWPNVDPNQGANRLKVTLHRLRSQIGVRNDELILRDEYGLWLDPGKGWQIDLWEWLQLIEGSVEMQLKAIMNFHVNVLDQQFTYSDEFDSYRDFVQSRWFKTAATLIKQNELNKEKFEIRISELGLNI